MCETSSLPLSSAEAGVSDRATFELADAAAPLPFEDGSFDALLCIDAINHLATVIAARVLRQLWRPAVDDTLRPLADWCAAFDRNRQILGHPPRQNMTARPHR